LIEKQKQKILLTTSASSKGLLLSLHSTKANENQTSQIPCQHQIQNNEKILQLKSFFLVNHIEQPKKQLEFS